MSFLGYPRPDGSVGTRNFVLVLPGGLISQKICEFIDGVKTIITPDSGSGRTGPDRETVARILVGLAKNPNVAGVILHNQHPAMMSDELKPEMLAEEIRKTGKPVELISEEKYRDSYELLVRGYKAARKLVHQASFIRRREVGDEHLCLGVKCGVSDATSGMAGNPSVGRLFDRVVENGGTAMFGETTEIIGAEHALAGRAVNKEVAGRIVDAARNIEEKSLGAICKSGTGPIHGVLQYGERPPGKGLYFVDNWMSLNSIFLGYTASGANVTLMQRGGAAYTDDTFLYPSLGVVAPLLWCTGNTYTYDACNDTMDYCSGTVIDGEETIEEAGDRLLELVREIASGARAKSEMLRFQEANKMYFQEGAF